MSRSRARHLSAHMRQNKNKAGRAVPRRVWVEAIFRPAHLYPGRRLRWAVVLLLFEHRVFAALPHGAQLDLDRREPRHLGLLRSGRRGGIRTCDDCDGGHGGGQPLGQRPRSLQVRPTAGLADDLGAGGSRSSSNPASAYKQPPLSSAKLGAAESIGSPGKDFVPNTALSTTGLRTRARVNQGVRVAIIIKK